MAYAGYLIKIGGASGTILPLRYFRLESYSITPDQRQDLDSGSDSEGYLHRNVLEHTRSKIELETIDTLTDTDVAAINAMLPVGDLRRDVTIQYYDPETNAYKVADCYMPDIKYPIRYANSEKIEYMPIRYAWIEY